MNKSYIHFLLLVLLFLGFSALCAETENWATKIADTQAYLQSNPADISARSALAYYYMMNNQALLGLREYRTVAEADSSSLDANSGILWALNTLEQYPSTIRTSRYLFWRFPDYAPMHNFAAYAYLNSSDITQARYHYRKAAEEAGLDVLARQIALEGLGWTYLLLDNSALAIKYYDKAQSMQMENVSFGLKRINSIGFNTSFSYSVPDSLGRSFHVTQALAYRTWKLDLGMDEFQLRKQHFRTAWQANLYKRFEPLQIGLHYTAIDGNDARVYPLINIGLTVTPDWYVQAVSFKLEQSFNVAQYQRFNGYQYSIRPEIRYGKWQGSYSYSYHYQDNEAIDADSIKSIHRAQISRVIYKGSTLGCYAGLGDMAWSIDSYFNLTDDFDASQKYVGCSIFVPIAKILDITQYNEWGYSSDSWHYLFYLKLGIRY